jgi:hypothetical protein
MITRKTKLALIVASTLAAQIAGAATYCENKYANEIQKAKAAHVPALEQLQAEIKRVQDAGLDPHKYVVEFDGQWVPLTYKYAVLYKRYETAATHAAGSAAGCAKAVAPAQLAADLGVIIGTAGTSLLLPERMPHIDMGEILHGKPFGGDSALIPKAREDLIEFVSGHKNDNGEIAVIIRDPIKCTVGRLIGKCRR